MGECVLELPTAFTPNWDGYNDFYVIHGLGSYPVNTFKVFNRWGNEVFSKENYTNLDWYGQDNDGGNLPDGTYFVTFIVKKEGISKNTYVDLRR
jgi:gliding motility-associated-like protein